VLSAGRPGGLKAAVWSGAGLIAALVAFSRVYLGLHWWTDVVAGLALGGLWLCLLGLLVLQRGAGAAREIEVARRGGLPGAGPQEQVPAGI
jgi:undecaprenyl-diphosphatase